MHFHLKPLRFAKNMPISVYHYEAKWLLNLDIMRKYFKRFVVGSMSICDVILGTVTVHFVSPYTAKNMPLQRISLFIISRQICYKILISSINISKFGPF